MNTYFLYEGKPEIINYKKYESLKKDSPTLGYIDLLIPTLYGLNEKLRPDSSLMKEFQKEWEHVTTHIDDTEYGCYVYYPTRNTVVRYMDPKWHEIALLVSNSLLYNNPEGSLTWEEVRAIHKGTVIAVAGCSVGKRVLENVVANIRPQAIKIADPKASHVSNAPRAGWTYEDIGRNKAIQTALQIAHNLDPFIQISVYKNGINHENIDDFVQGNEKMHEPKPTLIIEETDDLEAKIWIREKARASRVPVIMVSDLGSSVQIDIRRFDLNPDASLAVGISDEELFKKRDLAKQNPGNLEIFYDFVFAMLGHEGMRGEFKKIVDKEVDIPFGGIPQLTSTVSASAGWVADIISRMQLGWTFPERLFFDMAQSQLLTEGENF